MYNSHVEHNGFQTLLWHYSLYRLLVALGSFSFHGSNFELFVVSSILFLQGKEEAFQFVFFLILALRFVPDSPGSLL